MVKLKKEEMICYYYFYLYTCRYLLQAGNVSPEYVDHLNDFYKDCGIKMEVMKRE